jgi:hypothetical protein
LGPIAILGPVLAKGQFPILILVWGSILILSSHDFGLKDFFGVEINPFFPHIY